MLIFLFSKKLFSTLAWMCLNDLRVNCRGVLAKQISTRWDATDQVQTHFDSIKCRQKNVLLKCEKIPFQKIYQKTKQCHIHKPKTSIAQWHKSLDQTTVREISCRPAKSQIHSAKQANAINDGWWEISWREKNSEIKTTNMEKLEDSRIIILLYHRRFT